ncbi:MAG TPA: HPF/RaiA family ribosome-associated protein [Myxococcaceae bacterium]|nr:HPF/RaiA family ribosome-associated protein [Myxococcaceae bacterium]
MKVLVRGVHMTVDDRLREHVERQLVPAVARLHDGTAVEMDVAIADVNGPKGGLDKEVGVTFRSPNFGTLYVSVRDANAYAALDQVRDRMVRRVRRQLERRRSVARDQAAGQRAQRWNEVEAEAFEEKGPLPEV